MAEQLALEEMCLGRFVIGLPKNAQVSGHSQRFWGSKITRRPAIDEATAKALIDSERAALAALEAPPGHASAIAAERRSDDGRFWSAVYFKNGRARSLAYSKAIKSLETDTFLLERTLSASKTDLAMKYQVEIADALVASDARVPEVEGFCIDGGVIQLPARYGENAELAVRALEGVLLVIETRFRSKIEDERLLEGVEAGLEGIRREGYTPQVLRVGKRSIDDLKGDELLVKIPDAEGIFFWDYPGRPKSGTHPHISIRMTLAPGADYDAAVVIWDAVLDSLRRRSD